MNDTPFYMSSLKNDSDFVYAKHFHFIYAHLESAADLTFSLSKEAALVQKIMIATTSSGTTTDITYFTIGIKKDDNTDIYDTMYVDLSNGIAVVEKDINIPENSNLVLGHETFSSSDYTSRLSTPGVEFDIVLFCKPINSNKKLIVDQINKMNIAYLETLTISEIEG